MFPDAEKAFTQVLKLDKNCEDAVQELLRVRTHQIMVGTKVGIGMTHYRICLIP